jgi:hypothetical protein
MDQGVADVHHAAGCQGMQLLDIVTSPSGSYFNIKCSCGITIKHPYHQYRVICDCGKSMPLRELVA